MNLVTNLSSIHRIENYAWVIFVEHSYHWCFDYRLEVISLAAFSHDLGVLRGEVSAVADSLTALGNFRPSTLAKLVFLIAQGFPAILRLPTPRNNLISQFSNSMDAIIENVLRKARDEPAQLEGRSALAVLCKILLLDFQSLSQYLIKVRSQNTILSSDEIKVQVCILYVWFHWMTALVDEKPTFRRKWNNFRCV